MYDHRKVPHRRNSKAHVYVYKCVQHVYTQKCTRARATITRSLSRASSRNFAGRAFNAPIVLSFLLARASPGNTDSTYPKRFSLLTNIADASSSSSSSSVGDSFYFLMYDLDRTFFSWFLTSSCFVSSPRVIASHVDALSLSLSWSSHGDVCRSCRERRSIL